MLSVNVDRDFYTILNSPNQSHTVSKPKFDKILSKELEYIPMNMYANRIKNIEQIICLMNPLSAKPIPNIYRSFVDPVFDNMSIQQYFPNIYEMVLINRYSLQLIKLLYPHHADHVDLLIKLTLTTCASFIVKKPEDVVDLLNKLRCPPKWQLMEAIMDTRPANDFIFVNQNHYDNIVQYMNNIDNSKNEKFVFDYNYGDILLNTKSIIYSNNQLKYDICFENKCEDISDVANVDQSAIVKVMSN